MSLKFSTGKNFALSAAALAAASLLNLMPQPVSAASETGKLCYKDRNPENPDPYNRYRCDDAAKPHCCKEGDLDTCCDYDPTQRTILQQLTIWGLLLATMVGLITMYMCCFRARNNSGVELRGADGKRKIACCFPNCRSFCSDNQESYEEGKRYRPEGLA